MTSNSSSTTATAARTTTTRSYYDYFACPDANRIFIYPAWIQFISNAISMTSGIPLNIILLHKLLQLQLYKKQSYAVYVLALTIADLFSCLAEIGGLLQSAQYITDLRILDSSKTIYNIPVGILICPFFNTVRSYCWYVASWILVVMGFERYISVRFPLRVASLFSSRKAFLVCLSISFTGIAFIVPSGFRLVSTTSYSFQPNYPMSSYRTRCAFNANNFLFAFQTTMVSEITSSLLPSALLGIATVLLVYAAKEAFSANLRSQTEKSKVKQRRLTATVTAMCLSFFILTVQYAVIKTMYTWFTYIPKTPILIPVGTNCKPMFLYNITNASDGVRSFTIVANSAVYIARSGHFFKKKSHKKH